MICLTINKYGTMDKVKFKAVVFILISIALLMAACDQVQLPQLYLQGPQKFALQGTSTKTPFQIKSTYTLTSEPPPTLTASLTHTETPSPAITEVITETPKPEDTATETATVEIASATASPIPSKTSPPKTSKPGDPTVRVSITTNCRTGPGVEYPKLTPLQADKVVPLIGRTKYYPYWIIKDPGKTGRDCWLWSYYATTTGNVSSLPIYDIPEQDTATPKPSGPTKTPTDTKTPRPSYTPNLTPATFTNTPLPPTITLTPSTTPTPSDTPLPTNTPLPKYCPYTSPSTYEEQQIFDMINQARRDAGLNTLRSLNTLVSATRDHGQDMTCNGMHGHNSSDGTRAWERIGLYAHGQSNWCDNNCCCGEIVYGGGRYLTPAHVFDWWMNHPQDVLPFWCDEGNDHRCTILGEWYTHMGVGVIIYERDGVTRKSFTVDFTRR